MPKRQPSQNRGGRSAKAESVSKNAGHALSQEVRDAIAALPQIKDKEWSKSYLAEQLWRNYLGLTVDYDLADLAMIAKAHIVE